MCLSRVPNAFLLLLMWLVAASATVNAQGGGRIVYTRKVGEQLLLHVMNADGTNSRLLPGQQDRVNSFASWSPDGRRIAYQGGPGAPSDHFTVWIANADGSARKALLLPDTLYTFTGTPAWSPDGKQIAFEAYGSTTSHDLYVAGADGTGPRRLNPPGSQGMHPFWLSDGRVVGYSRVMAGEWAIVLAQVDGSGEAILVAATAGQTCYAGANALSPDGRWLAYATLNRVGQPGLRILELATRTERAVEVVEPVPKGKRSATGPYHPAWFRLPAWAPDGRALLLALPSEAGIGLFQVGLDGKIERRLTPKGIDCLMGAWTVSPNSGHDPQAYGARLVE